MARSFALPLYQSRAWRLQRVAILKRDLYRCRDCGRAAEEVHHIVHLTPQNIHDINITLNPENLVSLCFECHRARHNNESAHIMPERTDFEFDEDGNVIPPGGF